MPTKVSAPPAVLRRESHNLVIFAILFICVYLRASAVKFSTSIYLFLRRGDGVINERVGFDAFGFAFEGEDEAVAEGG